MVNLLRDWRMLASRLLSLAIFEAGMLISTRDFPEVVFTFLTMARNVEKWAP